MIVSLINEFLLIGEGGEEKTGFHRYLKHTLSQTIFLLSKILYSPGAEICSYARKHFRSP